MPITEPKVYLLFFFLVFFKLSRVASLRGWAWNINLYVSLKVGNAELVMKERIYRESGQTRDRDAYAKISCKLSTI